MADIKYPDFAGESGCTRSGDVISLTGTAISNHVTFASAEADSAIDFDNGDTLYVDVIDGSGNAATWSATYDTTGDGTLTRTATVAGTAVGSLGTTGIQVTSSVPGPWFRAGERISYVTESVTTGNVTVGVNRVHSLTIAGLTANRNFTVPSGSPGDWIGIHIDDGDDTYAIIIIGDTGVDVGNAGAATEKTRLFIQNETYFLRCRAANDWFVEHDGRIPCTTVARLTTAATGESANTLVVPTSQSGVWTEDDDTGDCFNASTSTHTARRDGNYWIYAQGAPNAAVSDQDFMFWQFWDGSAGRMISGARQSISTASQLMTFILAGIFNLSSGNTTQIRYKSQEGSRGLAVSAGDGYYTIVSFKEVL